MRRSWRMEMVLLAFVLLQLAIAVPVTDTSLLLEAKINGLQRNRTGYLE